MQIQVITTRPPSVIRVYKVKKQQKDFHRLLKEVEDKRDFTVQVYNTIPEQNIEGRQNTQELISWYNTKAQEYKNRINQLQRVIILVKEERETLEC